VTLKLQTPRLTLSPLTEVDAPEFADGLANWNVARMMRMVPHPYTVEMGREWIGTHVKEREQRTAFRFGIRRMHEEVALIGLSDVDEIEPGSGSLGYWLREDAWGKGYATEAATAVLKFSFSILNLDRLISSHASDNEASGRVLTKLGFHYTGDKTVWSKSRQSNILQRRYMLERRTWLAA
jgi:[ribosomal protein S5]-alanine N-acetyltransferase